MSHREDFFFDLERAINKGSSEKLNNAALVCLYRRLFKYNPVTGILVWQDRPRDDFKTDKVWKTWNTRFAGKEAGPVLNSHGYRSFYLGGSKHLAHRVIWAIVYGEILGPKTDIDHVNHNRADNRLANLRAVPRSENAKNKTRYKTNCSGHVGICRREPSGVWSAYIQVNGRQKYLGNFKDIEDAINARARAKADFGYHAFHGVE